MEASSFWIYASSLVRSRPKGAGQTCELLVELNYNFKLRTYHRGTAVSRDLALSSDLLCRGLVPLIDTQITSDRPFGSTNALSGLIELRSHIQVADLGFTAVDTIENDKGVDLKVGEVKINVDTVEADEEIDESVLLGGRDMLEEGRCDGFARRERLIHREVENKSLGVNITDVDTTFVCEEDRVALTSRGNADIVFCVCGMGQEGLNDEVVKGSCDGFDLK